MKFLRRRWFVSLVGLLLLAVTLTLGYTAWLRPSPPETLPISEVMNRAEQRTIVEATVQGNVVTVVDQEGVQYQAVKEEGAPIAEELRQHGVKVTVVPSSSGTPWPLLVMLPISLGVLFFVLVRQGGLNPQMLRSFSDAGAQSGGSRPTVTFADVAGGDEAKYELQELVEFLRNPERFRALGARVPRGVLLIGPPGTGKTLIARAVAGEASVPFFHISGSQFVEMFVGVGAARVRALFQRAKRHAPSIIFIDEIDAVGGRRRGSIGTGSEEREQTLNQLLVEMDGFDSNTNVIVIAATNRPDVLDPALLRPGRFDRQVMMDTPDVEERRQILEVHAKDKKLAADVDLAELARQTPGFSGADLANVLNEAAILAARAHKSAIEREDLQEAVLRTMAGPEKRSRMISPHQKRVIAYHEAGHAVAMRALEHGDPVTMVSVVSRGRALGITVQRPDEDRYLMTREQLMARMVGAMGGRAAEELVFGTVTTGAAQDIQMVNAIARRMVEEFGMSPLGLVSSRPGVDGVGPSESLASRIDEEVMALVDEAYRKAKAILVERRDQLEALAERLIEVETVQGEELDALLGPAARTAASVAP